MNESNRTATLVQNPTVTLVQTAFLIAVILLMAFTPIGYIKTLGLEITLIVVPVAVGAVILGPKGGALLGAVFGLTSFAQCFGMSPLGPALFAINPAGTFIVCFVPRVLEGFLAGLIYQALKKTNAKKLSVCIANLCCPLLNTILYMTCFVLFFYQTDYVQQFVTALGAANPFTFVLLFVGINGLVEAIACFVVGTAISEALLKVNQRF